jgi:hypothetical protein
MGEPVRVESKCNIYSSIVQEVGIFTSITDGISI